VHSTFKEVETGQQRIALLRGDEIGDEHSRFIRVCRSERRGPKCVAARGSMGEKENTETLGEFV